MKKIIRNIKCIVKILLTKIPISRKIIISRGFNLVYKNNLEKLKFQGQFLQDMIAYLYFQKKQKGSYIDIGANDGITVSNTYIFEQLGWGEGEGYCGVCIEPQPDVFERLRKYRKCDCYNVALSATSRNDAEFLKFNWANTVGRLNESMSKIDRNNVQEYGKAQYIKVKTMTFDGIMENYPGIKHIDFLSLDVEGHEMNILKTIDFSKYSFGLMTIEKNEPEKIVEYLKQKGYRIFMELENDIMFVPA
ncbi:hypothetical protein FACS189491_09390 [Spirochaetia bacterium]|nr:hypothetical protein FACS189491_09390 [Spirochaetia bacterium]